MTMRLKIMINVNQDYQKALETANYLLLVTGAAPEDSVVLDENNEELDFSRSLDPIVIDYLELLEPRKKAIYL